MSLGVISRCASLAVALEIMALPAGPAFGQVTGSIDSTMTLEAACEVNEDTATSGVDFGTLDFGSHSTFFSTADAQVDGNGSGSISVQCTPGYNATLTIVSGANDGAAAGGGRALKFGTDYIPYDIYSDSGFSSVLDNGAELTITGDGSVQLVPIYGQALGASGLPPGTYTDTISVTLAF